MRPPARAELPALREPAVLALVLHVRAGGLGLAAGHGVRQSYPSLSTSWDLPRHDSLGRVLRYLRMHWWTFLPCGRS